MRTNIHRIAKEYRQTWLCVSLYFAWGWSWHLQDHEPTRTMLMFEQPGICLVSDKMDRNSKATRYLICGGDQSMAIAHKSGLSAHCCNILHPLAGFPDMKTKSLPMSRFLHLSTLGIFYPSQSIPFTLSSQIRCASLLHIICPRREVFPVLVESRWGHENDFFCSLGARLARLVNSHSRGCGGGGGRNSTRGYVCHGVGP